MFGLETLDVAIGVIFVFLLVSILVSAVREAIEAMMKTRGAYLWLGIRELLHDKQMKGLARSFYSHPLIFSLFPGDFDKNKSLEKPDMFATGGGAPSYIPARNFAVALIDIVARGPVTNAATSDASAPVVSLETIRANIANLQSPAVQRVLLTAVDTARNDLDRVQASIEAWYDSAMDRVSGWYKRSTQWWLFWIALFVAVGMNVNTLVIVDFLYSSPTAREELVHKADVYRKTAKDPANDPNYKAAKSELESLKLPIGWNRDSYPVGIDRSGPGNTFWNFGVVPVVGWLMTAFAATLGAPFWFDLLNKVMVIRSTVKPHEKSPEEASEDRQKKPATVNVAPPGAAPPPPPAPPPPAQPPLRAAPAAGPVTTAMGRDPEADLDDTHLPITTAVQDEDLPQAKGGVK